MKWTEKGNTLEVSYFSKRMWYLLLLSNLARIITDLALIVLILYIFWWIGKNDVVVHLFNVLEGCS